MRVNVGGEALIDVPVVEPASPCCGSLQRDVGIVQWRDGEFLRWMNIVPFGQTMSLSLPSGVMAVSPVLAPRYVFICDIESRP